MKAEDFLKKEKNDGFLKHKSKLNNVDICFLMEKFAKEYHEDKVKHLDLGKDEKNFLNGRKDIIDKVISYIEYWKDNMDKQMEDYSKLSRAKKKTILAFEASLDMLYKFKMVLYSYLNHCYYKELWKLEDKKG